jgi:hypothetical protein
MIVATKGSQESAHNFNPVNCARLRRNVKGREGFAAECRQSTSCSRTEFENVIIDRANLNERSSPALKKRRATQGACSGAATAQIINEG